MDITIEQIIPIERALIELKAAPLEAAGDQHIPYFQNAVLRLVDMHPHEFNPSSLYVLRKNLEFQRALRRHLIDRYQIDTLQLSSVLYLRTDNGLIGMAPPYVEISEELVDVVPKSGDRPAPPGQRLRVPLLIDGFHRAWIAREENTLLRCVLVHDTDTTYLNYAYPNSWSDVAVCETVPEQKKYYRRVDKYSFMIPLSVLRRIEGAPVKHEWGRSEVGEDERKLP